MHPTALPVELRKQSWFGGSSVQIYVCRGYFRPLASILRARTTYAYVLADRSISDGQTDWRWPESESEM